MSKSLLPQPRAGGRDACRRGFTLIEVSITIIIIALLAGLALVAIGAARRTAQQTAERQVLVSLKNAITGFKGEFGFLPPLVHDNSNRNATQPRSESDSSPVGAWTQISGGNDNRQGPVDRHPAYDNQQQPVAIGESADRTRRRNETAFLEGFSGPAANAARLDPDYRYSAYSLTYYLMGALDNNDDGKPIDGATGAKITEVRADGTFSRRGKGLEAKYDIARELKRRGSDASSPFGITFNDRWLNPIRYYRWETRPADPAAQPGSPEAKARTLVPRAAGDPRNDPKLRSARFALVSTGPDGYTDMRAPLEVGESAAPNPPRSDFTKDDIVEVEE